MARQRMQRATATIEPPAGGMPVTRQLARLPGWDSTMGKSAGVPLDPSTCAPPEKAKYGSGHTASAVLNPAPELKTVAVTRNVVPSSGAHCTSISVVALATSTNPANAQPRPSGVTRLTLMPPDGDPVNPPPPPKANLPPGQD